MSNKIKLTVSTSFIAAIIAFSALLFVPTGMINDASATTTATQTDDIDVSPPADIGDIIPDDDTVGPVAIVDELQKAHSDVTGIMLYTTDAIANTGYVNEEVYLEAVYVDEENMTLVLWLDPAQMYDPIDEEDIQEELGITVPIEIKYGYFETEALSSEATTCPGDEGSSICYYWERYINRCLPTSTTSRCNTYSTIISGAGYALPTLLGSGPVDTDGDGIPNNIDQCDTQPETVNNYQDADGCPDTPPSPPTTTTTTGTKTIIFSDNFENGFSKWRESGQLEWQIGLNDDGVVLSGHSNSNKIAEADDCDDEACILSLANKIDLSSYSAATLEFDRYVDSSLDRNEYLAVEVGNNGVYTQVYRWTHGSGDDKRWHHETVDLSSYLRSGFDVRFVTEESSSREDVGIDNVKITGQTSSSSPCILTVTVALQDNGSMVANWNSCDDIKYYKTYLSENDGVKRYHSTTTGTSKTYNSLTEGSSYEVIVRALRSDNIYTDYFTSNKVTVPVSDRTAPVITVPSNITLTATSAGNPSVTYAVSAYDAVDGTVSVNCTPASRTTFPVGTTTVTCTARDTTGNEAQRSFTVTVDAYIMPTSCPDDSVRETGTDCEDGTGLTPLNSQILYGGQVVGTQYLHTNSTGHDVGYSLPGTISIGIVKDDGTRGIVVAAHQLDHKHSPIIAGSKALVANFPNDTPTTNDDTVFITAQGLRSISTNGAKIDATFLPVLDGIDVNVNRIVKHDGTYVDITKKGGIYHSGFIPAITLFGSQTNSNGHIIHINATVLDHRGILLEQAIGRYVSIGGDSGGPIVHQYPNGTSALFGTHVGRLCNTNYDDTIPTLTLINHGRDILCHDIDERIKVISTWENIAEELHLP